MDTIPPLPANPWASRQRWFVLALVVLFVGLSIQYTFKALDPKGTRSAILRWREQLLALDKGENIYDTYIYPNPPIMALILNPLADLPPLLGALTWFYLKVGMTLVGFFWLFRLVQWRDEVFPPLGKALAVILALRPIMGDLVHGNVNLFILFVLLAALYTIHKGHDVLGGILLALSIACKVTPALFLPYLVWKRAWKTLAGCAVGLVLFFIFVPAAFLGWGQNLELLSSWTSQMVTPFVRDGIVTSTHNNQSLPGLAYRLATHSPSFIDYEAGIDREPSMRYHNLIAADPAMVRWVIKGCMGLFALMIVLTCRTPWSQRGGWRLSAEFSLVVLGMLLFSERTWKHHCVTFVLPFGVIVYYLTTQRPGPRLRAFLVATLVVTSLLMASTSTSLLADETAKLAQVYGAYVVAYFLLGAALVVLLRQPQAVDGDQERGGESAETATASHERLEVMAGRISLYVDSWAGRMQPPILRRPDELSR